MGGPGSGRPAGQRNYTKEEQFSWAQMYVLGKSISEISAETGVGAPTVTRGVRRYAILRPRGGARKAGTGRPHNYRQTQNAERAEKMRIMYCEQEMTLQAIGDQ